ncbi:hypothetical protein F4703DRAFT_1788519 [Phycomyces blakesleeanus]
MNHSSLSMQRFIGLKRQGLMNLFMMSFPLVYNFFALAQLWRLYTTIKSFLTKVPYQKDFKLACNNGQLLLVISSYQPDRRDPDTLYSKPRLFFKCIYFFIQRSLKERLHYGKQNGDRCFKTIRVSEAKGSSNNCGVPSFPDYLKGPSQLPLTIMSNRSSKIKFKTYIRIQQAVAEIQRFHKKPLLRLGLQDLVPRSKKKTALIKSIERKLLQMQTEDLHVYIFDEFLYSSFLQIKSSNCAPCIVCFTVDILLGTHPIDGVFVNKFTASLIRSIFDKLVYLTSTLRDTE